MEMPPTGENNQEKIEKEKVLEMLRTNGLEHFETNELVTKWTLQKEAEVKKENTSRAAILLNIDRTDLYIAIGDNEGAIKNLEDALEQADQENEKELQDQIIEKIKALKI